MADRDRLSTAAFTTAHVTLLTVLGVLWLHLSGEIGDLLNGGGTIPGAVGFLLLWTIAFLTHRRGFARTPPWDVRTRRDAGRFLVSGAAWGAITGAGLFWALAGPFLIVTVASDPTSLVQLVALSTLFLLSAATALALAIGGVVGLLAGILDLFVIGTARLATDGAEPLASADDQ